LERRGGSPIRADKGNEEGKSWKENSSYAYAKVPVTVHTYGVVMFQAPNLSLRDTPRVTNTSALKEDLLKFQH
jgi:hypothetical protein